MVPFRALLVYKSQLMPCLKNVRDLALPLNLGDVGKPEVIFLLANHNPRSGTLKSVLSEKKLEEYAGSELFDLRFHVAGFSGYAMHSSNMLPLDEFIKLA